MSIMPLPPPMPAPQPINRKAPSMSTQEDDEIVNNYFNNNPKPCKNIIDPSYPIEYYRNARKFSLKFNEEEHKRKNLIYATFVQLTEFLEENTEGLFFVIEGELSIFYAFEKEKDVQLIKDFFLINELSK